MENKKAASARRRPTSASSTGNNVPPVTEADVQPQTQPSPPTPKKVLNTPYRAKFVKPQGWSDEDLRFLFAGREDGLDYYLLACALKRPISEIKRIWRSTNWELSDWFDYGSQKVKNSVLRTERQRIVEAKEKRFGVEKTRTDLMIDELNRVINPFPPAPAVWRPSPKPKGHQPEDVVLLLSDLHIGHNHTLQETNGLSEYNPEVFKKRVNNLKKSTADIVELHSKLYETPSLHIACLGDIVDGMNSAGEWSSTYIGLPIYDQWQMGCEALAEMIYYWLGLFENINFYGVRGNHGRAAPKGVEKDYVNWDILVYKHLELMFKNEKRVKFNVPESWYIFTTIRNHKFLMVHGDEIAAAGSPIMKLQECESRMMGLLREIPDYTVAGHFHNAAEMATNHGKVILNGSFIGSDVYSLKSLQRGCKPVQKIFGVHDNHGITWTYDINLKIDR